MPKVSSRYFALTALSVTIKSVAMDKTLKLPDGSTTIAPIAPGAYAVVADGVQVLHRNKAAGSGGLESLAEDGNAEAFIAHLQGIKGVREAGLFVPGQAFEVTARPGERLVFATVRAVQRSVLGARSARHRPVRCREEAGIRR